MPELQRVDELGFADFVAMLLVETLYAIVSSHTSQEERLRALASAAEQNIEEFTSSITDDIVSAALAQLFPDGKGGTAVEEGAAPPSREDLDAIGIALVRGDVEGSNEVLTARGVRRIAEGVRLHLAQSNLESIRRRGRGGGPPRRGAGGGGPPPRTVTPMRP
ncbi:MAG: hypothetical protein L0G23_04315, partial [Ruaniaceae bacterium]|nr:hypothetical protein [Ruaniaceae bacterium]